MGKMLNHLRGRPHDERVALAAGVSIAVVVVLCVVWFVFFTQRIATLTRQRPAISENASYQQALAEYNRAQAQLNTISAGAEESVAPVREYADRIQALEAALSTSSTAVTTTMLEGTETSTTEAELSQ